MFNYPLKKIYTHVFVSKYFYFLFLLKITKNDRFFKKKIINAILIVRIVFLYLLYKK